MNRRLLLSMWVFVSVSGTGWGWGCTRNPDYDDSGEPGTDAGGAGPSTDAGTDVASPSDVAPAAAELPLLGDGGSGDLAPGDAPSGPDAAPNPCVSSCARFSSCAVEVCEGFELEHEAELTAACLDRCLVNASVGIVIDGAASCAEVVDFGRQLEGATFNAACRVSVDPPGPNPPPPVEDGSVCAYACADGEVCQGERCVRLDGTCATDYHCVRDVEICVAGRCGASEFAPCRQDGECRDTQYCFRADGNPLGMGSCVTTCEANVDCPFNERCFPEFGDICYFDECGGGAMNGEVYGACRIGGAGGFAGTCFPSNDGMIGDGICLEAGDAPAQAECNLQADGRDAASRALQCAPGTYCWGDFDDALDPALVDTFGACAPVCDPRESECGEDSFCLDLTSPDNPMTPDDDPTYVGLCIVTNCDVLLDDCGDGESCGLQAVTDRRGVCREDGPRGRFEPCVTAIDCADGAVCGEGGTNMEVCLPPCDPAAMPASCEADETCFTDAGWAVGFCVKQGD